MSYSSQVSLTTPDISEGFIDFLTNGEFDEMLSNTPRRLYYDNLLTEEENISVDEIRSSDKRELGDKQRTNDKTNIDSWAKEEDSDDILCLEALETYIWGEGYADDERLLLETCTKIESRP